MRSINNKIKLFTALVLCSGAPPAIALPITYNFTGTATSADGIFANQGTLVSGSFSFDDGLVDSLAPFPAVDFFTSDHNPSLIGSFAASLMIGSVSVSSTADVLGELRLEDREQLDSFDFGVVGGPSVLFLHALDIFGNPPDGVAAGSENLTDSIAGAISILDNLNLSKFDNAIGGWTELVDEESAVSDLRFTWTGIERAVAVPEPTTFTLLAAGMLGLAWMRRRRSSSESHV